MPSRSFDVSGSSICCRTPPQPTTVGTDRHTSRTPYSPCCKVETGSTRRVSRTMASIAAYPKVLREHMGFTEELDILFGIALGFEDAASPTNQFRTSRGPVDANVTFLS